ncbi:MAG: NADPH dehydrogenase NamA [Candidatus Acidulodesulfobacterium ferriphilum]|uniref:NADPH dehydrogenase NamA n=1 Tax=Candidatus Acidulodesulfobacterium ferriphilum TaxID=2597223 RepID=A0A519B9L3_9DELT|nr:MAG: NADPH dehydrogenase NamA [Candidatus Acidulodesulfobacterium ferriphilum]
MKMLFEPIVIGGIKMKNRIMMAPMCMYSAEEGVVGDFHMAHLGARAVGGVGLIIVEATGVSPEGRISPYDAGIWNEKQVEAFKPVINFCKLCGSVMGIQLAHAGRKASTNAPWLGERPLKQEEGAWQVLAPSAIPFDTGYPVPKEMNEDDIKKVVKDFANGAKNADKAGFDVIEIHAAHGYLINEFLSPVSNKRKDKYGGSLENRARLLLEIIEAIKSGNWPKNKPIFVRISAVDWVKGGFDIESAVILAKMLKESGISLIDCSSGGISPTAKMNIYFGYQLGFAKEIREKAGIAVSGVGLITKPEFADFIISSETADMVEMGRELLRDPYWPLHAAYKLGVNIEWPKQYLRAKL